MTRRPAPPAAPAPNRLRRRGALTGWCPAGPAAGHRRRVCEPARDGRRPEKVARALVLLGARHTVHMRHSPGTMPVLPIWKLETTVSCVETTAGATPTPEEARRALTQLAGDESAVRYPPLPWWFFVVQTCLLAGLFLAQILGGSDARNASFAVVVASAVLGGRYWFYRPGVAWVSAANADVGPFVLVVLGVIVVAGVAADTTGTPWAWVVGAVVAAALVLLVGRAYRKAQVRGH